MVRGCCPGWHEDRDLDLARCGRQRDDVAARDAQLGRRARARCGATFPQVRRVIGSGSSSSHGLLAWRPSRSADALVQMNLVASGSAGLAVLLGGGQRACGPRLSSRRGKQGERRWASRAAARRPLARAFDPRSLRTWRPPLAAGNSVARQNARRYSCASAGASATGNQRAGSPPPHAYRRAARSRAARG